MDSEHGADRRRLLRRLTVLTAGAAVAMNLGLLLETASSQPQGGDLQDGIVSVLSALFPAAGLRSAPAPTAFPTPSPHAVTGAS